MTEQNDMQLTQEGTQEQPQAQTAPVTSISAATQQAPAALAGVAVNAPQPQAVPAPKPVELNRLAHNEQYTYTDENGFKWNYTFQFPGTRLALKVLDDSQDENGNIARYIYWDLLLKYVVVAPSGLTLDDFDKRPGLNEVMGAADTFLGKWMF